MKIIEFIGGTISLVRVTEELAGNRELLGKAIPACGRLIISARTVAKISGNNQQDQESRRFLISLAANVLVYGFEPTQDDRQVLQELTSSSLLGVEPSSSRGGRITVVSDARNVCMQFSGLSFDAHEADTGFTFVEGSKQGACSTLISIRQRPFFVRWQDMGCQMLLLAGREFADLDANVPRGTSILQFFSRLAPVLMFLHSSSRNGFWQNDAPAACLVIDDPLLKRRYGFLDYEKLLDVMERERFCTSIAFIPWNYRRSDRRLAKLFTAHPHRYSLCVHGSDHTRGEFGSSDELLLREKAQQALERMNLHRKLAGVDFDDVMVFPQCIFSTAAMKALKSCGYLAVANSSEFPIDARDGLPLSDLLEVAITRFSNVPLFIRRAARNIAELAFDLFLGKPALLVEHHGYFREGYDALAETVEKLNGLDERLQWANPATIFSRACLKKTTGNGDIHVRFFTKRFCLQNETDHPQHYVLLRHALPQKEPESLSINGHRVESFEASGGVEKPLSLEAGQEAKISVAHGQFEPTTAAHRQNHVYEAKVFLRRSLSEFRDNYLQKLRS